MTTPFVPTPPRPQRSRRRLTGFLTGHRRRRRRAALLPRCGALLASLVLALPLAALLMGFRAPAAAEATPRRATTGVTPTAVTTAAAATMATGVAAASATPPARQWVPPVHPLRVVRAFQPPPAPWAPGHRGVDLALPAGGSVVSAGSGVVTFAGRVAGLGVVVVRTGDLRTTYEPVAANVHVGEVVRSGEPLGTVAGRTHCAPDVCLHWGLLRGETYLDPLTLLTRPVVRLLPLAGPVVWPAATQVRAGSFPSSGNAAAPSRSTSEPRATKRPLRATAPTPPVALAAAVAVAACVVGYVCMRTAKAA